MLPLPVYEKVALVQEGSATALCQTHPASSVLLSDEPPVPCTMRLVPLGFQPGGERPGAASAGIDPAMPLLKVSPVCTVCVECFLTDVTLEPVLGHRPFSQTLSDV